MSPLFRRIAGITLFAFVLAMLPFPQEANAYSWLAKSRISRIVVHDWGDAVFLVTDTVSSSEPGCGGSTLLLLRSNPQFKEIYAAALMAQQTRATIGGFIYGCDPTHYNLPILQRIDLLTDPNVTYP